MTNHWEGDEHLRYFNDQAGVTAGEVVEAKVHRFSKNDDGSIGLDTGRALACHRTVPVVATEDDEGLLG